MKLFTILFLAFLLVLSACMPQGENCDLSYSFVNGACCLDKNANNICDKEETQRAETVFRDRPVVLIEEICNLPRFSCVDKQLTSDYVYLNLRFERDEIITIKKITLNSLKCSAEFDTKLNFNDGGEFKIPCVIDSDAFKTD